MVIDLSLFITQLQQQQYEIILGIDANEGMYQPKNELSLPLQLTNILNSINQNHDIKKSLNTYLRKR